ncbi:MAG: acyltransferase [Archangiaceae bacterium]|nr:acyltransferase [Archangiaceae bacterium]
MAVTLVVLFHAWPSLLPGGFVGVDVFFVISGFVVARMVAAQLERGSFGVKAFFLRRVNRLAPAMLLMLVSTLVASALILSPTLLAQVVASAAGALTLVANLVFAMQAGYFDQLADVKPLLHCWSLAVEEQFYLAVPLAVLLGKRLSPRVNDVLLVFCFALSFGASVWLTSTSPQWAYLVPTTRAWELLEGVLLARAGERATPSSRWLREVLSVAGLLLILGAAIGFDRTTVFPGAWAALPVGGTVLVLATGPRTVLASLVSRRVVVGLGLISYPLYLWHWPALTLGRLALPVDQHAVGTPLLVALSLVLSVVTWRFVERPVRQRQSRTIALALVGTAAALAVALTTVQLKFTPDDWAFWNPVAAKVARFEANYPYEGDAKFGTCWLVDERKPALPQCIELEPPELPLVMVWGDSHAARLTAGLRALQAEATRPVFRLGQRTRSSCPPLFGVGSDICVEANEAVLVELRRVQPTVLILDARWRLYPNQTLLRESLVKLRAALPRTAVVVVGPVPEWRVTLPWVLSMRVHGDTIPERSMPIGLPEQRELDRLIAETVTSTHTRFVSAIDELCTSSGDCLVKLADEPLMLTSWDYGHLTTPAARLIGVRLLSEW